MKNLIVLIALVAAANAEFFNRPCRSPEELGVIRNFSPRDYLGVWYEIERYEACPFQIDSDCVRASYTFRSDGNISITHSHINLKTRTPQRVQGTALFTFPNEQPIRAMMNVTFSAGQMNVSNYWILGTDYLNFSLYVACFNVAPNRSLESYYLLSRRTTLTGPPRVRAEAIKRRFIDVNRIRPTVQDINRCRL